MTTEAPTPFTTLPEADHPGGRLPDGVTYVTPDEMRFLREMAWAENGELFRQECSTCGEVMVFERHPADWPNHPGEPGEVRVAVECPRCGTKQYVGGATEVEHVAERTRALTAEVMDEVAARLRAESVPVSAGETGSGGDAGGS